MSVLTLKVLPAITATEGLWLARGPLLDVQGATRRASNPVGPASFYEHCLSCFLVTELFDRFYQRDSLSKTLAWHLYSPLPVWVILYRKLGVIVKGFG